MKKTYSNANQKKKYVQFHDAPTILLDVLSLMNLVFTFFFLLETVLKLIAFGFKVCNLLRQTHTFSSAIFS